MKVSELIAILNVLEDKMPNGVGEATLSRESGVGLHLVSAFLNAHPDYFIKIPLDNTYQVNRMGIFKGSHEAIVADFEKKLDAERRLERKWLFALICFAVLFVSLVLGYQKFIANGDSISDKECSPAAIDTSS